MTTMPCSLLTSFSLIAAVRRSWLIAIAEAAGSAAAVLLLGATAVDPEIGFAR